MRRLALVAAAVLALVACGSTHKSSNPQRHHPARPSATTVYFYPEFFHVKPTVRVSDFPRFVSATRLGIETRASSGCVRAPDEIGVVSPHLIRIHMTSGTWHGEKFVTSEIQRSCRSTRVTPMLVAIDPKVVDVNTPLTIHVYYFDDTKPSAVWSAAPLRR